MNYETAVEIELALSSFFDARANLIVPNVSWGLNLHECDILILSKAGYATEVEIKVSKADLKKDRDKGHGHVSDKIKRLYFAVPEKIDTAFVEAHVPARAGIIVVNKKGKCRIVKQCTYNMKAKPFSDSDRMQLARLGAMRIWGLKRNIVVLKDRTKEQQKIIKELTA